jgi:parallel beta-helix repeat protein
MNDRTKLLLMVPCIALLGLLAFICITFAGSSMASATCVPPVSGNWDINAGELCNPVVPSIILSGDLTIKDGGTLTLDGVNLQIDSNSVGERTIRVEAGGTLNIAYSTVSSTDPNLRYNFIIEKGAKATLANVIISDCGYDSSLENEMGLYIASDSVSISQSTFRDNWVGLYIKDASPKIENSNFLGNMIGIYVEGGNAKPKISGNYISGKSDNMNFVGTSPKFTGTLINLPGEIGIILIDSTAVVSGNTLSLNSFLGVYIQSGSPTVQNNTIDHNTDGLRAYYSDMKVYDNDFINNSRYTVFLFRTSGRVENNLMQSSPNPYLNTLSYGIYLCTATTTIKGNTIEFMKQMGLAVLSGSDATIMNNNITYFNGMGVRIASSKVHFEGNLIHNGLELYSKALSISGSSGIIKGNTFEDVRYGTDATYIDEDLVFDGNTYRDCTRVGMTLFEASIVVKGNTFESNLLGLNITSAKPQILNNSFTDNYKAINVNYYTDAYIFGNHFMLGNFSIVVWQGKATIVNNTIRFSNNFSIWVSFDSHVNLIGNFIDGNNQYGSYIQNSDGYLENNTFSHSGTGLYCRACKFNFKNNNFTRNGLGIEIFESTIELNGDTFANNTYQAIMADTSDTTFNGVKLYDNKAGLLSFASNLTVLNMTIINNEIGMLVWEEISAHIDGLHVSGSKEASVQVWNNDPKKLTVYFDNIEIFENDGKFQIEDSKVVISTSLFWGGKSGIELKDGILTIQDSTFIDMNATAIWSMSSNVLVQRSLIFNNTYGLNADGSNLTILESRIEENNESGIQLSSTNLVIRDTRVVKNKDGIIELGKSSFDVLNCNISSNLVYGLYTSSTSKFVKVNYTRKIINEDNQFMIHGQMVVSDGGQLYLLRSNVQFWSDTPGASGLVVLSGGQLIMRENVVSSNNPDNGYYMKAESGGLIHLSNATIRHCGKGMSGTSRGLEIRTDKAYLSDLYFEDNNVGLFVYGTTIQAQKLRFNLNVIGLYVMDGEAYIISSKFNGSSDKDIILTRSTGRMLDTKFAFTKAEVQDQGSILIVMWYLKVTVVWNDGQPVSGAAVSVIDKSNAIIQSTTDAQGNTIQMIVKEYTQKGPDPTGYVALSPHIIRVKFNGITVDKVQYVGTSMEVTVSLKDEKPPIITVTTPAPGEIMYTSNVLFIGTAMDEGSAVVLVELSLDGKNWFAANGTEFWSGFMTVPDGVHVVQVRGTDSRGNQIIITVSVEVDTTSPLLQILSPPDGTITNSSSVKVYGLVHQGAQLLINGKQVHVEANGTFLYIFNLTEGQNKLNAKAFGRDNQTMSGDLVIIRDTVSPQITLLNPKAGAMVNTTTITVTVSSNEEVSFFINGKPVSTFGGKADTTVDLIEGPNTITVRAVDLAGNPTIYSFNVTLDITKPSLILNKPAATVFRTTNGKLLITGITEKGANLTLDGKVIPVGADGTFKYKTKLRLGKNDFVLTSKDQAGNTNSIALAVTRKQVTDYTLYYVLFSVLVVVGIVADVGTLLYFKKYYKPKGPAGKGKAIEDAEQEELEKGLEGKDGWEKPRQDQRRRPKMPPPPKQAAAKETEFEEVKDLGSF